MVCLAVRDSCVEDNHESAASGSGSQGKVSLARSALRTPFNIAPKTFSQPREPVNSPHQAVNSPHETVNSPSEAVSSPHEAVSSPHEAVNSLHETFE